jgi:hypothetical protein
MKIHHETKIRTWIPYLSINFKVDFEGSAEEWEKVREDLLPKIESLKVKV